MEHKNQYSTSKQVVWYEEFSLEWALAPGIECKIVPAQFSF